MEKGSKNLSQYYYIKNIDLIWFDLIWFDLIWFDLMWLIWFIKQITLQSDTAHNYIALVYIETFIIWFIGMGAVSVQNRYTNCAYLIV